MDLYAGLQLIQGYMDCSIGRFFSPELRCVLYDTDPDLVDTLSIEVFAPAGEAFRSPAAARDGFV